MYFGIGEKEMRKRYLHDFYGENDIFWDRNWDGDWRQKCLEPPPVMFRLVTSIKRYLRPDMLLLEGGCGDGRYLRFFNELGVKTVGVDFAHTTVQKINEFLPNLEVHVGDIRKLNFPDRYFDAYYSGGVIEHFEDGVAPQLAEAYRVLKNQGYFFVTVPHMNLTRRCAALVFPVRYKFDLDGRSSYHKENVNNFFIESPPDGFHFHEYVFTSDEIRKSLANHGFNVVEEICFSSPHGMVDISPYRRLIRAGQTQRTIIDKFFAIPLKYMRKIEDSRSVLTHKLSNMLGLIFGNLKLYVCIKE